MDNQHATTPRAADLELLAELQRPDLFQRLVDNLPAGPIRASLRLWGVVHGVYRLSDETQRAITHEMDEGLRADNSGRAVDSR